MKRPRVHVSDGISGGQWEREEPRDLSKPDGRRTRNNDPRFKRHESKVFSKPEVVPGRWTRIKYVDGKRTVYVDGVKQ